MAKNIYMGIGGVARKCNKAYIGIGGVARRVKKGYIGVGGVARPFMSNELEYYGSITPLAYGRYELAATSVSDYALFAGGIYGSNGNWARNSTSVVSAYDKSLTRTRPTALSFTSYDLAATTVGDYALFGGGHSGTASNSQLTDTANNVVNAYNNSLTRTIIEPLTDTYAYYGSDATTVGNYAIFAPRGGKYRSASITGGGISNKQGFVTNKVIAYNNSLTRSYPTTLTTAGANQCLVTVGNYALFGGGVSYLAGTFYTSEGVYGTNNVEYYNTSLTHGVATSLSVVRASSCKAWVGNYALFCGGASGSPKTVETYNKSLTRGVADDLTAGYQNTRDVPADSTTISEYALVCSAIGFGGGGYNCKSVEVYNASLTHTIQELSNNHCCSAATSVGDYALVGGGGYNSGGSPYFVSSVEAYTA